MISVEALVAYAQDLDDEGDPGDGLTWLKAKRDEAVNKITGGSQFDYISTTVDGQTFTRKISATAQEWFEALQLAIRRVQGTAVRTVYAKFQNIPH